MEYYSAIKRNKLYTKIYLTFDGHISGENCNSKRYMHPSVHSALFTIAKTWKQSKCPSTDEWIKKMW